MVALATANVGRGNDGPRINDLIALLEFPDTNLRTLRMVGTIKAQRTHWVPIIGKEGGKTNIPVPCRAYDDENTLIQGARCPFCDINHTARATFYCNVIDEQLMNSQPRRLPPMTRAEQRTGFKDMASASWTPCRVWAFPPMAAETLATLTKGNKNERGEIKELYDPVFGRAVDVAKNPKASTPAGMWTIQRAEKLWRKLSIKGGEDQFLTYDLGKLTTLIPSEKAAAKRARELIAIIDPNAKEFDDLDLSEYADSLAKNKAYVAKFGKGSDEDDDRPKRAKKESFSIRGRDAEDDEDTDADDDAIPSRTARRRRDDDDNDTDTDEDTIPRRTRPVREEARRPIKRPPEKVAARVERRPPARRPEREEREERRPITRPAGREEQKKRRPR
jgi:hypothetical protein